MFYQLFVYNLSYFVFILSAVLLHLLAVYLLFGNCLLTVIGYFSNIIKKFFDKKMKFCNSLT